MLQGQRLGCEVEGRWLWKNLDLTVAEGEVLAVVGPSGCGKTLLLRTLAWLQPASEGQLHLDGQSPRAWGAAAWRADVAYVAQRTGDLPGTPESLGELFAAVALARGRDWDDPVELAQSWNLPVQVWQQPWSEISGGEAQRALLALHLARRPRVLLLDEPTAALDPAATAAVEGALRGRTVIWVTHDGIQAKRVAARTLVLGETV